MSHRLLPWLALATLFLLATSATGQSTPPAEPPPAAEQAPDAQPGDGQPSDAQPPASPASPPPGSGSDDAPAPPPPAEGAPLPPEGEPAPVSQQPYYPPPPAWRPPPRVDPTCVKKCRKAGLCIRDGGRCVAVDPDLCMQSERCRERGECVPVGGRCRATTSAHCRRSNACAESSVCFLTEKGTCTSHRAEPGLFVGGIVAVGIGGAGIVAGGVLFLLGGLESALGGNADDDFIPAGAISMGGGAAIAVLAGVPLLVLGSKKVEPRWTGAQLQLGPTGGSLTVSF